jgi:hypothetical protein
MALIRGRVNPLNVLGLRKLSHIPPHFAKMSTKNVDKVDAIDNWIYTKLDSRYCIKQTYVLDQANKLVEVIEIGVEESKELSMLSLGCPYLQ